MLKPSKNDFCYCGSTLAYRNCHYEIDKAGPQHRVRASRDRYDEGWTQNAAHYERQDCYAWMAQQLAHCLPKRIFDIGCGDGRGLLALSREYDTGDWQVFSIDENPSCIQRTTQLLRPNGVAVSAIRRCGVIVRAAKTHAITTQTGRLIARRGVNLFEGDILIDHEVEMFLADQLKFDAVTVWLMGTHPVRHECYNLQELQMKNQRC